MALYKFSIFPLRPTTGPLAQMVGSPALSQIAQLRAGGGNGLVQSMSLVGEMGTGLQDQINAINNILKLAGTVQVDGSVLPFTPPGGTSGQLQANNGAGGFSAVTTSAQVAASISDETGTGLLVFGTSPTLTLPIITQEAWTNVSTFVNSWVDGGVSGDAVAGFRKDSNGNVWARGIAKNGTTTDGTTIYTLPSGYRPTSPVRIPAVALDATPAFISTVAGAGCIPCIIRVSMDGTVKIYNAPTGTVYVQFAFSFPTA